MKFIPYIMVMMLLLRGVVQNNCKAVVLYIHIFLY